MKKEYRYAIKVFVLGHQSKRKNNDFLFEILFYTQGKEQAIEYVEYRLFDKKDEKGIVYNHRRGDR
jgi:hypothetical protein